MSEQLAVACPKCGVGQGERCRTLTTNRSTDTHEARWAAWFKARTNPARVANTPVSGEEKP